MKRQTENWHQRAMHMAVHVRRVCLPGEQRSVPHVSCVDICRNCSICSCERAQIVRWACPLRFCEHSPTTKRVTCPFIMATDLETYIAVGKSASQLWRSVWFIRGSCCINRVKDDSASFWNGVRHALAGSFPARSRTRARTVLAVTDSSNWPV